MDAVMKKLRRIKDGKKLSGVCAGLAQFFGIDVIFVRMIWVLICFFPPVSPIVAVITYAVLSYIIPEEKDYIDV